MNDDMTPQPTDPAEPAPAAAETDHTTATEAAPARTRLRDRAFGFRSALAVGAAGLVLGAAVGTSVTLAVGDHDHHDRGDRPEFAGFPGGPGERGADHGPFGGPGMAPPPVTPPDDGTQPDPSGDSTSGTEDGTSS